MKKRNRFVAALLSAMLLCTAVSPAASAEQTGRTHSGKLEFKAGEANEDAAHTDNPCWQWDKDTLALTLKGLNLTSDTADGAHVLLQVNDKPATVTLEGDSQITGTVGDARALLATNLGAGVLTVQGNGSLKAAGSATPLSDNAVLAGGTLILTDRWAGRLTVAGGTLQTAENASLTEAAGELTVNSGTVALAASEYAVSTSLVVNGGSVALSGGTAAIKGTITLAEGLGLLAGADKAGAVPVLQYSNEKYATVVPNHSLSGMVKDASGTPVVGASVEVNAGEGNFSAEAITDETGGYSVSDLPAYDSYALTVSADSFDDKTATADLSGGDAAVNIDLAKSFVAVTGITDVPVRATVGEDLTLSGAVEPANATNRTIVWSVESAGDTQAAIANGVLSAGASGTVTVRATIENGTADGTAYTDTFEIFVDKTKEQKLAEGKALADGAVKALTATNATTADEVLQAATEASAAAGEMTVEWSADNGFQKVNATETAAGSVKGTLNISHLGAADTIAVDLPIAQLPKSDTTKVAEAKAAADTAVNALTATNNTTADDILNAAKSAVGTARAADAVSVDWKNGAGFQKTDATETAAGAVTGTLVLALNGETSELAVNLPIAQLPESNATKVTKAKEAADAAVKALAATNETSADSILNTAKGAVTNGVNVAWKADSFQKTDATETAAGSVTGTLVFSLDSETQELSISLEIEKLPVPTKIKVPVPSLKQGQYVYTGSAIKAQFNAYDANIITSNETAGTAVGTYKTRLNLKDTSKYEWDHATNKDGGWEYTWEIIASATPTPAPTAKPSGSPAPTATPVPTATPAPVPKTGDTRDFTVLYWVLGISAAGALSLVGVKLAQKRKK